MEFLNLTMKMEIHLVKELTKTEDNLDTGEVTMRTVNCGLKKITKMVKTMDPLSGTMKMES